MTRNKTVMVRLTDEEHEHLSEAAVNQGATLAGYLRTAGHQQVTAATGFRAPSKDRPRLAPEAVRIPDGACVGTDSAGREVFLPYEDRLAGVFAIGDPGSGKNVSLHNYLAADSRYRSSGKPHAMWWFATTYEGTEYAAHVMRANGVEPFVFSVGRYAGPRLELVDRSRPPSDHPAHMLARAMTYTFGSQNAAPQSSRLLTEAFRAAIDLHTDETGLKSHEGPGTLMDTMLHCLSTADAATEPLRNQLLSLVPAQGLWKLTDRDGETGETRASVTIKDLLDASEAVVIDLSPVATYNPTVSQHSAALIFYALWDAVRTHCQGWKAEGRSLAVFSDEVSYLCREQPADSRLEDILMRLTCYSHGVMPVYATQNPNLIDDRNLEVLESSGTRHCFRLCNPVLARKASESLYEAFDPRQIITLPTGQCITTMLRDGQEHRPFVLRPRLESKLDLNASEDEENTTPRLGSAHEYRLFLSRALEHSHPELVTQREAYEDATDRAETARSSVDGLTNDANEALNRWDNALRRIASGHHIQPHGSGS